MGYRILYGSNKKARRPEKQRSRLPALTGMCFLIFCVLTATLWPEGVQILRARLFPNGGAVTAGALEHMTQQLRAGGTLWTSLGGFFREMLRGPG